MIHDMGYVEFFEMCETSTKVAMHLLIEVLGCWHLLLHTWHVPTFLRAVSQYLNQKKLELLAIPNYIIKENPCRGATVTREYKKYDQARDCLSKAKIHLNSSQISREQFLQNFSACSQLR